MKKTSLLFFLIPLVVVSCHNFHIEKRQHRKGFHLQSKSLPKQASEAPVHSTIDALKVEKEVVMDSTLSLQVSHDIDYTIESPKLQITDSKPKPLQGIERTPLLDKLSNENQLSLTEHHPSHKTKVSIDNEVNREVDKEKGTNNNALYYFLLAVIVPFGFLNKKTENISRWAASNVIKTRIIIAVGVVAVLFISVLLGHLLRYSVAPWMIFFSLGLLLFSIIGYFISTKKQSNTINTRKSYRERLFFTNIFNVSAGFNAFALGTKGLLAGVLENANWNFLQGWLFAPTISEFTPDDEIQALVKSVKIMLILLLVFLLILIAILSCYLYCSYGAAIGTIVLVGGVLITVLGFTLGILALKKIRKSTHTDDDVFRKRKIRLTIALFSLLTLFILAMIGVIIVTGLLL